MANKIEWLRDKAGNKTAPKTVTNAIYDKNGKTLDTILTDIAGGGGGGYGGVTGVKGSNEDTYRTGDVEITPENLGITVVNNTADADKSVNHANTAAIATKATQDSEGNIITDTYLEKTGDASNTTETFTVAGIRENIVSGETNADIFGKIAKVINDLAQIAFSANYSDLNGVPEIPAAVAIKGSAESTYRTGNIEISPASIGLDSVDNTADTDKPISAATQLALTDKVDKVEGKGLSANDYTTDEKTKLSSIATGAEVNQNTFSNVQIEDTTIAANDKSDTLSLVAGDNVNIIPDATSNTVTIDATDTVYTHPSYDAKTNGLYKVTVDETGHVSGTAAVEKSDITALGIPAQDTTYSAATQSEQGLMSAEDKTKLDTIDNLIDSAIEEVTQTMDSNDSAITANLESEISRAKAAEVQALTDAKSYTDAQINAIPTPDVSGQISTHNTDDDAHNDIRVLIATLTERLDTLADSDDETLDQMSEIVAYIKANKDLIDSITTTKVNVSDIVNNLTTNVDNKPLSAAQGVAIKGLLDALQTAVDSKADSADLHTHSNKSVLDNTTASYTTDEKTKLSGIATGAEVNQNAFGNVKVGSTTIAADAKTDTLELVAGSNVTITPDATNDKVTIAATDTVYTHPSYTEKSSGLYKVAVDETGHVSGTTVVEKSDITALGIPAQDTTYSNFVKSGSGAKAGLVPAPSTTAGTTKYLREDGTWATPPDTNTTYNPATQTSIGLMSAADKTKLDGIGTGIAYISNSSETVTVDIPIELVRDDIADNLTTTDSTKVLSANQGTVLSGMITAESNRIDTLNSKLEYHKGDTVTYPTIYGHSLSNVTVGNGAGIQVFLPKVIGSDVTSISITGTLSWIRHQGGADNIADATFSVTEFYTNCIQISIKFASQSLTYYSIMMTNVTFTFN